MLLYNSILCYFYMKYLIIKFYRKKSFYQKNCWWLSDNCLRKKKFGKNKLSTFFSYYMSELLVRSLFFCLILIVLYYSLCLHCICNFFKSCYVSTKYVVCTCFVFFTCSFDLFEDVFHDVL